jgi:choline-glycine betaine transporter
MGEQEFNIKTARTIKNMDNKIWKYDIQPSVFFISAGLIFAGVVFTIAAGESAEKLFSSIKRG